MFSRASNVLYHQCALGRGPTRAYEYRIGKSDSDKCRYGCDTTETIHHLLVCPLAADKRVKVELLCTKFKLAFTLKELFTNTRLQIEVEKMLLQLFR